MKNDKITPKTIYRLTCTGYSPGSAKFTFYGTVIDLLESIQNILYLHADAFEFGDDAVQKFPNLEEIMRPEPCCFLLEKYYGAEQATDVDQDHPIEQFCLNNIWSWYWFTDPKPETHTDLAVCLLNPELMEGIKHRRYKPGLAHDVYALTLHGFRNNHYTGDLGEWL